MRGRAHTDPLTPEATKRSTFVFLKAREPERTGIPHLLLSEVNPSGLEGVREREREGGREREREREQERGREREKKSKREKETEGERERERQRKRERGKEGAQETTNAAKLPLSTLPLFLYSNASLAPSPSWPESQLHDQSVKRRKGRKRRGGEKKREGTKREREPKGSARSFRVR